MQFEDIIYAKDGHTARITINRPEAYNAFRTRTLEEMCHALERAELDDDVRAIVLRGAGDKAFCTGGDTRESAAGGYNKEMDYWHTRVHNMIRGVSCPVIAAVNGWAMAGGHILHVMCDISIASDTAKFGQLGPKVGSFDAGFGAAYLSRVVGEKKAREIWFFCRTYSATEALEMGLVNKVVPAEQLDAEVDAWCAELAELSPYAIKFLKHSFNADTDHMAGVENLSMSAVRLYWTTEEALAQKAKYKNRKKASRKGETDNTSRSNQ